MEKAENGESVEYHAPWYHLGNSWLVKSFNRDEHFHSFPLTVFHCYPDSQVVTEKEFPLILNLSTCSGSSVLSLNRTRLDISRLYIWYLSKRKRIKKKKLMSRVNNNNTY